MTFNYTLTKDEFWNFHKQHASDTIKFTKYLNDNLVGLAALCLIGFIFIMDELKIPIVIAFVVSTIFLFIFKKWLYLNYLKQRDFKIICSHYKFKYLFAETSLTVDDAGITMDTAMNTKTIKWKHVRDLFIVDGNVLIRSFSDYDVLIPDRAIESKEDLNLLMGLFEKNASTYPEYGYPMDIEYLA